MHTMIGFFKSWYPGHGNGEPTVICAPVVIWKRALGDVKILNPECHACITGLRGDQHNSSHFGLMGLSYPTTQADIT